MREKGLDGLDGTTYIVIAGVEPAEMTAYH
jgi:hypothetical protein